MLPTDVSACEIQPRGGSLLAPAAACCPVAASLPAVSTPGQLPVNS
eukprot:CAMPEP_0205999574 /NCGR_PEP_ID=MMETSP1464-20131121/938_1 /ASSEMBLY_ACC=CAM_ASM_001124 /TAXON_ID=119497 /ORGANISM="Exanthemachrysis gayraliae, Strain RCC1523" /LENGTH=45 /DNA_ID= /DNA_START= /DNA_END= /DNA_ORIENTATION=